MVKKIYLGGSALGLILVILTSSYYLTLPKQIRMDIGDTRTIFSVYNNATGKFEARGYEYARLFDGSSLMRANNRVRSYESSEGNTLIIRKSSFKEDITLTNTYSFNNSITDKELVPVKETHCVENGNGKIFEYQVDKVNYEGDTMEIESPFIFDTVMKLEWVGSYSAKVYNNKVASDKIKIRFRVTTNDEQCFDIRLFDPEIEQIEPKQKVKIDRWQECINVLEYNWSSGYYINLKQVYNTTTEKWDTPTKKVYPIYYRLSCHNLDVWNFTIGKEVYKLDLSDYYGCCWNTKDTVYCNSEKYGSGECYEKAKGQTIKYTMENNQLVQMTKSYGDNFKKEDIYYRAQKSQPIHIKTLDVSI